jgi:Ca2+-binding RTX toxin-like protein
VHTFFSFFLGLILVLALGAGPLSGTAHAVEPGPVAAYSFDENSGSMAHDSSGAHDGNLKNGTTWTSAGKFGAAVHFDGIDDLITVPAAADLNLSKTFTVEAWVKPDALTPYDSVLTKEAGTFHTYALIPEGNHVAPKAEVAKSATENNTINSTSQLPLNAWSHLALTSDGSYLRLYVNGSQVASVPATAVYTAEGPTQIGGNLVDSEYFSGYADEVRIYNRTLSGTEIGSDKETAIGWTKPNPVAAYSFDENSGLEAHDAVGSHDGAFQNGTEWSSAGKFGATVHFDGIDDLITIPAAADLNLGRTFTLEAWVKPDSLIPYDTVLSKEAYDSKTYSLIPEGNHVAPKAEVAKTETSMNTINATSQLPLNTWSHLALTFSGEHLRLYVNGTQVASVPQTTIYTADGPTQVGGNLIDEEHFNGYVDEVRIYNRLLTAPEIGKDKEASLGAEWPETLIDSGPEGSTKQTTNTFTYHSTPTGSTFLCAVDAGAYASCPTTGYTTAALAAGAHTFSVKAKSSTGVTDPDAATRSFTVDTAAPNTSIEFGPEGLIGVDQPEFGYESTEEESNFECRFDNAAYVACAEDEFLPATPLADGFHTYSVRAVDPAGNVDATPATGSFTVDATAPTAQTTGGPAGPTANATPSFAFSAAGGTLTCVVESDAVEVEATPYVPCTSSSSYSVGSALADGSYTFVVKALDGAGNEKFSVRDFTVDTVAPQTTITAAPSATTDDPKPAFGFSGSEEGSSFSCRFDAAAFASCSGPVAPATALADGSHSFEVRALDAAGNVDSTPSKQTFTVKTTGPQTTIATAPGKAISATTASFAFSANKTATFECKLDAGAFAACSSSKSYTGLSEGSHSFEVRAIASAIADPTPARKDFVVDTSSPAAPLVSGALKNPGETGMTLEVEAKDGDPSTAATTRSGVGTIRVKIDGKVASTVEAPCESGACPATASRTIQLPYQEAVGTHTIAVESGDGVGHFSAPVSWEETAVSSQELVDRKAGGSCKGKTITKKGPIEGTDCDDVITAIGGGDHVIEAKDGNDIILGDSANDIINAGPGDDLIRGRRGSDTIFGQEGNDKIYGGVGDDELRGAEGKTAADGNDIVDGGPGADGMNGGPGADTLRGGQGEGTFFGGDGTDTFSFTDAVSPGYTPSVSGFGNYPGGEPGVTIDLSQNVVDGGPIREGGQKDALNDHPEIVIGSPYNDYIIGSSAGERLVGGPGADYIDGGEGTDTYEKDNTDYRPGEQTPKFRARDAGNIEVGSYDSGLDDAFYMAGSRKADTVSVRRQGGTIQFVAGNAATAARFRPKSGCKRSASEQRTVNCAIKDDVGTVSAFGDQGSDTLALREGKLTLPGGFQLLGGGGADDLSGSAIEDMLVDGVAQGKGVEHLRGNDGDDALLQDSLSDVLIGGQDDDLLINGTICRNEEAIYGDTLDGKKRGADNAQFHFVKSVPVEADLRTERVDDIHDNKCKKLETLSAIDSLEGSPRGDIFRGNEQNNLLLGRGGPDTMLGFGGIDQINAIDKIIDARIDCGKPNYKSKKKGDKAHMDMSPPDAPQAIDKAENCEIEDEKAHPYPEPEEDAHEDPPSVVQALFRLDEANGETTATNDAGGGADGTYEAVGVGPSVNGPGPTLGAATSLLPVEGGTSVAFDGVDDLVDLGSEAIPAGGGEAAFSVSLFARFDKAPGAKEFLFSSGDAGGGAFLYRNAAGKIVFSSGLTPGAPEVSSTVAVSDSGWHHLAGTLDGETIVLFVDGFPYLLGYGGDVMPQVDAGDQGKIAAGPSDKELFDGTVDEVATYESALSEEAVMTEIALSKAELPETLLAPAPEGDEDGDGVADGFDNCTSLANAGQADADLDGVGDACDTFDLDGDEIADGADNCPSVYNPGQDDADSNGIGDECSMMPPTVVTEPATSVGTGGATFNAKIDPEGLATTYRFEYGTTSEYGTTVPAVAKSAGSGATAVTGSQAVTGLTAATTYHYRVVAVNEAGQSVGEDRVFTTLP